MGDTFPKCFPSSDEFEAYVSACNSDESALPNARLYFCDYCTVKYQREMTLEERCENPDFVIPIEDEDDFGFQTVLF